MADFPNSSPLPLSSPSHETRTYRVDGSARRTLSPSLSFPPLQQTSLLPSTRTLFTSHLRPPLSPSHRRAAQAVSALASVTQASSSVSPGPSRQYEDDRLNEESSLLLALPLLPFPSPVQLSAVSAEAQAAREQAEAEDEADTVQAAAFLLSPVRSPKRRRQQAAAKDESQLPSHPARSSSNAGRSAANRTQRHGTANNFTDLDQLFSGELLLDDDDDDVYEPTTPHSSTSPLPNTDAIAGRTRARNPVPLSWDELELQSGTVLDIAEAELDTRIKRKRKRTDLLLPADDEEEGEEAGTELSSELPLMDAESELAGAVQYDDSFQRFVFSMNSDAPVSEDDEEFIPPPADDDDLDEYRDDRSTRVSRRELRELQGDAQMMQQDEEPTVEIDPDTLEISEVSKRKRYRQRGRSIERSPFSPPYPPVYDTRMSSFSTSPAPPPLLGDSSSVLYDGLHSHLPPPSSHTSSSLSLLPSPFVLPAEDVGNNTTPAPVHSSTSSDHSATAASDGLLSVGQLLHLRHQFNDHVQLLIQSRCLAQWWPEQNSEIHSITANIAVMMEELTVLTDEYTPSNVPMLGMWRAVMAEEEQSNSPIVQPTTKSLRDERRADVPVLDDWYGLAAQPTSAVHHSALHTTLLHCDWNPNLRLALHLRRAPVFTPSEDQLLNLAFLPSGVCHSPLGLPVYPDWTKVQQRYLPSKSVEEIRKRFHNVRCKEADEQHPLKRVKLHVGTSGAKHELDDAEMDAVEAAMKGGGRGKWAQLCRTSFPGWDRRTLKRTYEKCKRAREQASDRLKAETSNIGSPSPTSASSHAPSSSAHLPSRPVASSSSTASPAASSSLSLSVTGSGIKSESSPSSVMCDGGIAGAEVKWSKNSDRQLLVLARQHGMVVEQWPYAAVSALQTMVCEVTNDKGANTISVEAIAARLNVLLLLITAQRQ